MRNQEIINKVKHNRIEFIVIAMIMALSLITGCNHNGPATAITDSSKPVQRQANNEQQLIKLPAEQKLQVEPAPKSESIAKVAEVPINQNQSELMELVKDKPIERELKGGENHSY